MAKITSLGDNKFKVQSEQKKNKYYIVDLNIPWCDCRSFYFTKSECKHIKLVQKEIQK